MQAPKTALIVWGGWDGHEPQAIAQFFAQQIRELGMQVTISDSLDSFADLTQLSSYSLIVPIWTMGEIPDKYVENICEAVASGVGLAGCHGGMCDAFRSSVLWQFMTGGNWVSHPGGDGVKQRIHFKNRDSELSAGLRDFDIETEHYYLQVDPANNVLATTIFPSINWYHSANGMVEMPVMWTKMWATGRVFYNALGHNLAIVSDSNVSEMMRRGFEWAANSREAALQHGYTKDMYSNNLQNY
ncbi:hypothetical protein DBZ36_03565 [Alginatibacterium sediminis]|uniref:ThuA-like domain-containing protein n=1 Tax=Alginatibacterium sediminis TaxID=2164068 RepID=A0A420EFS5_9ALTE|nr:ThuA domain-containing protein [Alginatibacterium sediminis]RKF19555.1 hypothetical protein DBZ36_03565 [Alginatibacterium sediminis]